jgi:ubiquitin-conjugating enzyme E2 R
MSGETANLRWTPAQRVESVLLSILSLLDDANIDSPANVDASVIYRDDKDKYLEKVREDLDASKADIPKGFVMPGAEEAYAAKKDESMDYGADDCWADSDAELDFSDGGSGSEDEGELSPYEEEED